MTVEDKVVVGCVPGFKTRRRTVKDGDSPRSEAKQATKPQKPGSGLSATEQQNATNQISQQVAADSAALLAVAEERAKVLKIQEQLTQALNTNNELKTKVQLMAEEAAANDRRRILKLKSLLKRERKDRRGLEIAAEAVLIELKAAKAALEASKNTVAQLEAELQEASMDVMNQQKLEASYEEAVRLEREARALAEIREMECQELRTKLKQSEATRQLQDTQISTLQLEARQWESALDTLQEQLDHYMPNNLDTRNLITGDDIMVKDVHEPAVKINIEASPLGIGDWHESGMVAI